MVFKSFDHSYRKIIQVGIIGLIWFAALSRGAHDLWAATLLFAVTTLLWVIFCIGQARNPGALKFPLAVPLLLCIAAAVLSIPHSYDIDTSIFEAWGWVFIFLIYFLFINTVDINELDFVLTGAGSVVLPIAALCLWQQVTEPEILHSVHGTLVSSTILAGFVLYWLFYFAKRATKDRRYQTLFGACLIILLTAKSATSFLYLFLGFLLLSKSGLISWTVRARKIAKIASALLAVVGTWLFIHKIQGYYSSGEHAWTGRIYYWEAAFRMWQRFPWFGVGLGSFATAFPYFRSEPILNTLFAHSLPLEIAAEMGIIGILAFMVGGGYYLRSICCNESTSSSRSLASIFRVSLLVVFLFSLTNINLDYLINKLLFWILVASSLMSLDMPRCPVKPIWMTLLAIASVLLVPFWSKPFLASRLFVSGQMLEQEGRLTEAQENWLDAIAIDKYQSDSYEALSRLYQQAYAHTKSPEARDQAINFLAQAVRNKRDIQYVHELDWLVHQDR